MIYSRMLAPIFLALLAPVWAVVEFNQDVTPAVIFGSGNANGAFTTSRQNGVEIGIRGKKRYSPDLPSDYRDNGDGSYGPFHPGGTSTSPDEVWNFDWTVNSDYECTNGSPACVNIGAYTYELSMDANPTLATNFLVIDPLSLACPMDHEFGDNTIMQGAPGVDGDSGTCGYYNTLLAEYNVLQNSWGFRFFPLAIHAPLDEWNPNQKGIYDISIAAKDGGRIVAKAEIRVVVGGENAGVLDGLPEDKDDCKGGGWEDYEVDIGIYPAVDDQPIFKNQGQCIKYVSTGKF
jgi:hypothetical protein